MAGIVISGWRSLRMTTGFGLRRTPWQTLEAVERATLDGVDGFNQARRIASIGYSPHSEAGANYCRRLASQVAQRA